MSHWPRKIFVLIALGLVLFFFFFYDLPSYISLEALKNNREQLSVFVENHGFQALALFCGLYILTTSLSLPGAAVLTLAGGALFGFWPGLVAVSFSSTIGATLAFLSSRFLFRDFVQNRFGDQLESINAGVEKEGAFYLFSLRLIPVFPFFMINLAMGLTRFPVITFFFVSQLGMLAGTAAYVNAGTQLSQINSLSEIISANLLLSFVVIGLLPFLGKWFVNLYKHRKNLAPFRKPKKFDYNMIVIGAGSGGLVSAYIAAAVKAKVALFEKHKMGGDCLNTGCVPSKALIRSAKVFHLFKRAADFGLEAQNRSVQFEKVMQRIQNIIKRIEPHDSVERYTQLGVECFQGTARICSPFEVELDGKRFTSQNIVIATGASPFVPPMPGLDQVSILTSDNIWDLKALPPRLLVLGGGPIGCELAQSFARLGSQVTIVEASPRLLVKEDLDVSELIQTTFQKEGLQVLTSHRALRFEPAPEKILICESQGQEIRLPFDEVLFALGRRANTKGFGLEELGIETTPQGTVLVDEYLRTPKFSNVYACGDVAGPYQFTHTASHQAWYVAVNALFSPFKKYKADYRVIPWCTFTDPEVARVGLNEQEALQKKIAFEVTRYEIDDLDRAIADGEAKGFVKVLTKPGSDKILGVTIVGAHAGEIISEYVTAMKFGLGLNKILSTIHIYPTFAEANKFAAGVWKKATAPQNALRFLRKFHSWRRG